MFARYLPRPEEPQGIPLWTPWIKAMTNIDDKSQFPSDAGTAPYRPGSVTRQLSHNLKLATGVTVPRYQSVAALVEAYKAKDKTIADLTITFVSKAGAAKEAQDDILSAFPLHAVAIVQEGQRYHHMIVQARKKGEEIPWWTDYYEQYQDRLWESLRTMERRLAAYRKDPTLPHPPPDPALQLRKSDRKALIDAAGIGMEIVTAPGAGRRGLAIPFVDRYKEVITRKRLDDILHAGGVKSHEERYEIGRGYSITIATI